MENQAQAERRIPFLYQVPSAVKFVSVEPMLGPIDLTGYLSKKRGPLVPRSFQLWASSRLIDWIICGPETGPGARPFDPAWARDLRDQCLSWCLSSTRVHAFSKKSQQLKEKDIELSERRMEDWIRRFSAGGGV